MGLHSLAVNGNGTDSFSVDNVDEKNALTVSIAPSPQLSPLAAPPAQKGGGGDQIVADGLATSDASATDIVLYRVNNGGPTVASLDGGPNWEADPDGVGASPYRVSGGENVFGIKNGVTIGGRDPSFDVTEGGVTYNIPSAVFNNERFDWPATNNANNSPDPMVWEFPVLVDGDYTVHLFLAEGFASNNGRVFDASLEGSVPAEFDDITPWDNAGGSNDASYVSATATVTDGSVSLAFAHVSDNPAIRGIQVLGPSQDVAPEATDDTVPGTAFETATVINAADLLGNDSDANAGDVLSITGVTSIAGGTPVLSDGGTPNDPADDTITFTPDNGFSGAASFQYTVSDGVLTDTGVVTLNVAPSGNQDPTASFQGQFGAGTYLLSPEDHLLLVAVFDDPDGSIDISSIEASDLSVTIGGTAVAASRVELLELTKKNDPSTIKAPFLAADGKVYATFKVDSPSGGWPTGTNPGDTATLNVGATLAAGSVADDLGGGIAQTSTSFAIDVVNPGSTVVYALNLGGGSPTVEGVSYDNVGNNNALPTGVTIVSRGNNFNANNTPIFGADTNGETTLYSQERFIQSGANFDISFDVPNGEYVVELHFAENFVQAFSTSQNALDDFGSRLLDVQLEGTTVLDDFDQFATAPGGLTAIDRTFEVTVNDGVLNLLIDPSVENAVLKGVRVSQVNTFSTLLSIDDAGTVTEGGDAGTTDLVYALTATDPLNGPINVTYTVNGGANETQTVTFTNGSGDLTLAIANDDLANGDESFDVTLVSASGAPNLVIDTSDNVGTGTIEEDDFAPVPSDDAFATDSEAAGPLTGNVLSNDDAGLTVTSISYDGTTVNAGQSLTLESGATVTVASNGALSYDGASATLPGALLFVTDTFSYTTTDGANSASANVSIELEDNSSPAFGSFFLGVNIGGVAMTDSRGNDFAAGVPSSNALATTANGIAVTATNISTNASGNIANTGNAKGPNDTLFLNEGFNIAGQTVSDWAFATGNGVYVVELFVAEGFHTTAGLRVFDVFAEGDATPIFDSVDPAGLAGGVDLGSTLVSGQITVTDGVLDLQIVDDIENSSIRGIALYREDIPNTAPTAEDDDVSTTQGTATGDLTATLLDNDTDPDSGTTLVIDAADATSTAGATITLDSNGLVYDPGNLFDSLPGGIDGADSFTYTVTDGIATDTATVSVTITGVNDAAVISGDTSGAGTEDNGLNAGNIEVTGKLNATDIDAGEGDFVPDTLGGTAGDLTIDAAGNWAYTADNSQGAIQGLGATETLVESFTVATDDGTTATIEITINGANDGPVANDDSAATTQGTATGDLTSLLLDNDTDADTNDAIIIDSVDGTSAAGASVTFDGNGVVYDPGSLFDSLTGGSTPATDTFSYTVTDGATTSTATVTVTVSGADDPAVITGDTSGSGTEDTDLNAGNIEVSGTLTATDPDAGEGDFVTGSQTGTVGSLTINAVGEWTYTADNSQAAIQALASTESIVETFTVATDDGTEETLTITINGANDAPVAADDTAALSEDAPATDLTALLLSNDDDADANDNLTITSVGAASAGLVALDNGVVTFDPNGAFDNLNDGETDTATFTYTVSDGITTDTATVTVNVAGVTDFDPQALVTLTPGAGVQASTFSGNAFAVTNTGNAPITSVTLDITDGLLQGIAFDPAGTAGDTLAKPFQQGSAPAGLIGVANLTGPVGNGGFKAITLTFEDAQGGASALGAGETFTFGIDQDPISIEGVPPSGPNGAGAVSGFEQTGAVVTIEYDTGDTTTQTAGLFTDGSGGGAQAVLHGELGAALSLDVVGETGTPDNSVNHIYYEVDGLFDTLMSTLAISGGPANATVRIAIAEAGGAAATPTGPQLGAFEGNTVFKVDTIDVTLDGTGAANVPLSLPTPSQGVDGRAGLYYINAAVIDGNGDALSQVSSTLVLANEGNSAPVAKNDEFNANEDTGTSGDLTALNGFGTDFDLDGDALEVIAVNGAGGVVGSGFSLPSLAIVTVNANGTFTYNTNGQYEDLGVGESATDTFTYTISDGNGGTATATATIQIAGVNDAPTALDDAAATDANTAVVIDVVNNDSDIDTNDVLTPSAVNTIGTQGLVTINPDGTVSYDPNGQFTALAAGETATDTFSYEVSDGKGGTATATVSVTVTGLNEAPEAAPNTAGTTEDEAILALDLLTNDTDADNGDILAISALDLTGTQGTVTDNADGTVDYDPGAVFQSLGAGETAVDTFTYTVTDSDNATDTATVTITVTGVNDAPSGVNDAASTDENTMIAGIDVLANDVDIDANDVLFVQSSDTSATVGSVTDNGDGTFDYDPNGQFDSLAGGATATDSFTYVVSDGKGGVFTNTVTITIDGINNAPDAVNDSRTANQSDAIVIAVLDNDSDAEGDPLNVASFDTTGTIGLVTDNGDNTFTYDPNGQFFGLLLGQSMMDSFTYTVSDGNGGLSTATVTVTVLNGENDAPMATDDEATTDQDTPIAVIDVLANDMDLDFDPLFISAINTTGTLGIVTDNGDGTLAYDPNGAFDSLAIGRRGTDTFTYTVADGQGGEATATVTIRLEGLNDAPIAINDTGSTDEDTPLTLALLTDDIDVDGDELVIRSVDASGLLGQLTDNEDGTVTYDPSGIFDGLSVGLTVQETFTYEITDRLGGTDTAQVTITVVGTNDAPIANDDAATTDEDSILTGIDVLGNDTDVDLDELSLVDPDEGAAASGSLAIFSVDLSQTLGDVSIAEDNTISYDPNGQFDFLAVGETATDTFTYEVSDGNGGTDIGEVTVTITGANDNPSAANDFVSTDEITALDEIDVVINDTDIDGDTLAVVSVDTTGLVGLAGINENGTLFYDPNAQFGLLGTNQSATDTFTYTVEDAFGGTATATVTVTIGGLANIDNDFIDGSDDPENFQGNEGNDTIAGNGGNDTLDGGPDNDHICGGLGDDLIIGGQGLDELRGDDGNDTIFGAQDGASDAAADVIDGGAGDDVLAGSNGNDSIQGNQGSDLIFGNDGDDLLIGDLSTAFPELDSVC